MPETSHPQAGAVVLLHPRAGWRAPRRWAAANDAQLVAGVRVGDEAAFAELDRRHRTLLRAHAARILGHSHRALDDVVQDVLARALAALDRPGDAPTDLRPWLLRITTNRCIDEIRGARRIDWDAEAQDARATPREGVWNEVVTRIALREAVADIGTLPDRQRRALVAVAIDGRTHEDVAAELATTVQGSKNLVSRARAGLAGVRAARAAA